MFDIGLKDFRGFRETGFISIKPITLLVGENSAGKSSFLAGLKFIADLAGANEEPSFNKDPFQLGTFQQIAHYRGGSAGRAREFQLKLRKPIDIRAQLETKNERNVTLEIDFSNSESQAVISSLSIGFDSERLILRVENDQPSISYVSRTRELFALQGPDSFPRVPRSDFARYWPFILRDLRFRFRRKAEAEQRGLFSPEVEHRTALLAEYADRLSSQIDGPVLATSPIRTKPLRTYTPGLESRDAEGSHVPYEMAKFYRAKNKDAWRRLKTSIERFGNTSDMFGEISIKSFGQTASDPFQIQFSHDGPKTNMVDLGYGTSQVLPILYDISVASKRSIFLIQQPEVHLHPRAQSALGAYIVDAFGSEGKRFILETHSDFIVDRVRRAVRSKQLSPSDVAILFFERKKLENVVRNIRLGEDGEPENPPHSYRQFFIDEELKSLGVD